MVAAIDQHIADAGHGGCRGERRVYCLRHHLRAIATSMQAQAEFLDLPQAVDVLFDDPAGLL